MVKIKKPMAIIHQRCKYNTLMCQIVAEWVIFFAVLESGAWGWERAGGRVWPCGGVALGGPACAFGPLWRTEWGLGAPACAFGPLWRTERGLGAPPCAFGPLWRTEWLGFVLVLTSYKHGIALLIKHGIALLIIILDHLNYPKNLPTFAPALENRQVLVQWVPGPPRNE